jgi:hypothetical protein
MRTTLPLTLPIAVLSAALVSGQAPRTTDGHPDLQGTDDIAT